MPTTEEDKTSPTTPAPANPSSSAILDPKVGGLLAYLIGWISGLILYLISKDPYIRFHALQSIILFALVSVINIVFDFIPFLKVIVLLINIATFVLWIILMVKAYSGEKFKLPVIGDIAEKRA